jgi:hypothetical protein
MPLESQALYYHLGQNADDDGIVEGFKVMRMIGAMEDSMKLLIAKGFIRPLNDEYVVYVVDFLEHNTIRADRKVDSIYKDLLLTAVPDAKVIEAKPRSDIKHDGRFEEQIHGPSVDSPRTDNGPHKLSKVKVSKDDTKVSSKPLTAFDSALNEFTKMRKAIRKPLTDRAKELIVGKLESMYPGDEPRQIKCLEQSIENSWQGVFELKQGGNRNGSVKLG